MGRISFGFIICAFFIGAIMGAGALYIFYADPNIAQLQRDLGQTRLALDGAIDRSGDLERRIGEAQDLARASAGRVEDAVGKVGRITDTSKRLVVLIEALRGVVGDLRRLLEGMGT